MDRNWLRFAKENLAPWLTAENVLDRPVWEFISGQETRTLYRMLFERARSRRLPISIPFRCDSKDIRRFMRLTINPQGTELELVSSVLQEEHRPSQSLLDPMEEHSDQYLMVCSWCKLFKVSDEEWVEVEKAIARLGLFTQEPLPQLSHGICPNCRQSIMSSLPQLSWTS
ncbi:MAG: hypothetical protein DWQ01_16470 [Planctomycetota bacterium]|nr:MAG: hypothetical protein DWQ01_16470 [Planctomycetota bacterium]